jgi:hypothetical protein
MYTYTTLNLLFLVYHCHKQSIYMYSQVLKILVTYSLYFSSLTLSLFHKHFSFHLNTFKQFGNAINILKLDYEKKQL